MVDVGDPFDDRSIHFELGVGVPFAVISVCSAIHDVEGLPDMAVVVVAGDFRVALSREIAAIHAEHFLVGLGRIEVGLFKRFEALFVADRFREAVAVDDLHADDRLTLVLGGFVAAAAEQYDRGQQ